MVATTKVATTGMLQSAAALVHPLTVQAIEVLHVQLHFRYPLNCGYVTWCNCLPVCMSEIAKETYSELTM